jgi:uncharacterized membrane protein
MNSTEEGDADGETPLKQIVSSAVMALTFLVGFGLLALDYPYFWIAFPVGFAGLLPLSIGLVKYYEQSKEQQQRDQPTDAQQDALEALRSRYARGELTDDEFERKVEQLIETESVDDAESFLERAERTTGISDEQREVEKDLN